MHRSPVPPVAPKVLQQWRHAGAVVIASLTVLGYLWIPSFVSVASVSGRIVWWVLQTMDTDLLPELWGEMWVAETHLDEATGDLPLPDSEPGLITSSLTDKTPASLRNGYGPVHLRLGCTVQDFPRASFVAFTIRQFIHRFGRSTVASPRTPNIMIHPTISWFSIHGTLGYFLDCLLVARSSLQAQTIWPVVQYVWHVSPRILAMRLWNMFWLVTDGTGWLWIFWTCWLQQKKVIGMSSWLFISMDRSLSSAEQDGGGRRWRVFPVDYLLFWHAGSHPFGPGPRVWESPHAGVVSPVGGTQNLYDSISSG